MSKEWKEIDIQSYIDNFIEESLTLDFKAADALSLSDGKKKEITKDVSAMANSAGGILIYGLKEYQQSDKKHLVEIVDPVNRTQFSKEWLEQVVNNIRPRINGLLLNSVSLSTGANDVAYVIEIPQSHTAHQATDDRYYKRYNFMSVPMADHEIRDVMNRVTAPDVTVEFKYKDEIIISSEHEYKLQPIIKNLGERVVNNFKLTFKFPHLVTKSSVSSRTGHIITDYNSKLGIFSIHYHSQSVLFPNEERDLSDEICWLYKVDSKNYPQISDLEERGKEIKIEWILYADNMKPKYGSVPFSMLNKF